MTLAALAPLAFGTLLAVVLRAAIRATAPSRVASDHDAREARLRPAA